MQKNLFEGNTYSVIIPKDRAVDIDDEIDFLLAEKLFERKNDFKK
jgi:CMP-N-acetylneuraminic acid synthetase